MDRDLTGRIEGKLDKRVELNTASVLSLAKLLRAIIDQPSHYLYNTELCAALKSQGALAKFSCSDNEFKINGSSLNTIKRIAESSVSGGFDALDRLRIAAIHSLSEERSKDSRSNKSTKVGLTKRVNELEKAASTQREDLLLLSKLLLLSLEQGRHYASLSKDATTVELCRREQRVILDMLSLTHDLDAVLTATAK